MPELRAAFVRMLNLSENDWLEIPDAELVPAWGAALAAGSRLDLVAVKSASNELAAGTPSRELSLSQLSRILERKSSRSLSKNRLQPLFTGKREFQTWEKARGRSRVAKVDIEQVKGGECFLGIDSGSTTTKLVLVDRQGRLFFDDYRPNNGNPIQAVIDGLERLHQEFSRLDHPPRLVRSTVTGYGEDLVISFLGDDGMVETIVTTVARHFDPQVSFILNWRQDMKAIFVTGSIQRIEVNEARSSGCGTFIASPAA
jgi:activator of 2-hydroxyglutaryl-CoA dehydratase